MTLPHAFGPVPLGGVLRAEVDDFEVDEELGFEPEGVGEHAFLLVEKRDANTEWVARQLAGFAGVIPSAVGFAGLKDRRAVARQTISVQLPGRADPDWAALAIPGVRVLSAVRHNRKLRRGAHRGNRFRIRLRRVRGARDEAGHRLATIAARGVPNYFGEQRFGRNEGNLVSARALFAGARMPRASRSLSLSAARSYLFNLVLAERVRAGTWDRAMDGDVWMLAGSHSVFGPEQWSERLTGRLAAFDIHPTGPMWGRGDLRSGDRVREMEQAVAGANGELSAGLAAAGLEQERRSLRLRVRDLTHEWEAPDSLVLAFRLESGAFATTMLRELCDCAAALDG
ncbi:MAG TPA: tRNA pseudouridine(13) synthase TruD [Rhodanobacteraceae bacterium]|nr:tRNA pseudouridine(13) synthase TruD [Rhodanobacteraceae bacterium]